MLVIGLTGSIGMGKSTTAALFREAGVPTHDSDAAVHELYSGKLRTAIAAAFPGVETAAGIDRTVLGQIVLRDPAALKRLEDIVHPRAFEHRLQFLRACRQRGVGMAVCDIPLLFEARLESSVDVVLVVTAPAAVQKSRVLARPTMTQARFDAIVSKQLPDDEKRRRAHAIIDTGHGLEFARRQVENLIRAMSGMAGRSLSLDT